MNTQYVSVRFLIGLSSSLDPSRSLTGKAERHLNVQRRSEAERILTSAYTMGAFYYGSGVWKGVGEPCMSFETIRPDDDMARTYARSIARALADALDQEAIGLVFTNVELEFISS